ncbi:MAG: methyltransferase domain-containing protein [Deltaproteobacteria bacterium]|nr:MAG: methyltransferase domain-containing protein [Deltaproteobacteria bacterium]
MQEDYRHGGYDTLRRWTSYWYQIDRALSGPEGEVLLVGVGSGVVERELAARGRKVTTVDVQEVLKPDVIASVDDLPFEDGRFAVSICCQVLEHVPWEQSTRAMAELVRVTDGRLVISVPDVQYYAGVVLMDGVRRKHKQLRADLPRLLGRKRMAPAHHWEIGRSGTSAAKVRRALEAAGMAVDEEFRNPQMPYHRFFVGRG